MNISSSRTTTSRLRLSRTARIADGYVKSHIVEFLLTFRIDRRRGESTSATRDVANIISIIETLSSVF